MRIRLLRKIFIDYVWYYSTDRCKQQIVRVEFEFLFHFTPFNGVLSLDVLVVTLLQHVRRDLHFKQHIKYICMYQHNSENTTYIVQSMQCSQKQIYRWRDYYVHCTYMSPCRHRSSCRSYIPAVCYLQRMTRPRRLSLVKCWLELD